MEQLFSKQLFSSTDLALARRIEAGHAHSAINSMPGVLAEPIGGGWAIFHRIDSPVTQAIGIGMNGSLDPDALDRLERFFHNRGSAAIIDLCTLADADLVAMLQTRGYMLREISNVLIRRCDPNEDFGAAVPGIAVQPVAAPEYADWARMVMRGFLGNDDVPEDQVELMTSANRRPEAFFGAWNSSRCATAAMNVQDGLATLFGDATLLHARGNGMQLALIRHRIQRAAQLGCDLATASVVPGGTSHRNYERAGFQLVYARVMVSRAREQINC